MLLSFWNFYSLLSFSGYSGLLSFLSFLMLRRSNVKNFAKPTLANCPILTKRPCSTRKGIIGAITL